MKIRLIAAAAILTASLTGCVIDPYYGMGNLNWSQPSAQSSWYQPVAPYGYGPPAGTYSLSPGYANVYGGGYGGRPHRGQGGILRGYH